jgi:predicted Rossmann-fold nucleotide-binding protein
MWPASGIVPSSGRQCRKGTDNARIKKIGHDRLTELRVVASTNDRKPLTGETADGLIALPGGFGTLDAFSEVVPESR